MEERSKEDGKKDQREREREWKSEREGRGERESSKDMNKDQKKDGRTERKFCLLEEAIIYFSLSSVTWRIRRDMMSNTSSNAPLFLSCVRKDKVVEKKLWCWTHWWPGNKAFSRIERERLISIILDVHFYASFFVTLNIFTMLEIKLHVVHRIKKLHPSKQMKL